MPGILVVEDDINLRREVKEILLSAFPDILVMEATNRVECFKKLFGNHPDMVVMDIRLKAENGLTIAKRIKRVFPDMFVVIHSIYDSPEYRQMADEIGADHFLSKKSNSIGDMISLVKSVFESVVHNRKS